MRRQLSKLAREINQVLKDASLGETTTTGGKRSTKSRDGGSGTGTGPDGGGTRGPLTDPIEFAHSRIFIDAGSERNVEVWFDPTKVPVGTAVGLVSDKGDVLTGAELSGTAVPSAAQDGIAELMLTLRAGNTEGRHEVVVRAGGHEAVLAVHVRFPRSSGFISQIIPKDEDWEAGSALWDPNTGVVTVYVGRPEFKDAEKRARADGAKDPTTHPLYKQLIVESVREAALWPAAERQAEVDWDDLPAEERGDVGAFLRLVQACFQEFDYRLRAKLLEVFV